MDHVIIMQEMAEILRGDHPGWEGNRILNAETHLALIHRDLPDEALALAENVEAHLPEFSELTGLHPDRLRWAANRLLYGVGPSPAFPDRAPDDEGVSP